MLLNTALSHRYLLKAVGLGFPIFHGTGVMVASVGLLPYQAMQTPSAPFACLHCCA